MHACKPLVEFELQRQWPDCVPSLVNTGGGEAITNKVSLPGEWSLLRVPAELSNGKLFYVYSMCGRDIDTVCDETEMCINATSTAWIINLNACDSIGPLLVILLLAVYFPYIWESLSRFSRATRVVNYSRSCRWQFSNLTRLTNCWIKF